MINKMKFHHIGVACRNIADTVAQYELLGYKWDGVEVVDSQQDIRITFLESEDKPLMELLAPVDEASPVVEILNKNGTSPYHFCYSVVDLDASIKELRALKYLVVSKPKEAVAFGGRRVAFLYHKDMGLIELVEE